MCGICGVADLARGLSPDGADVARRMCQRMVHRGPDDEGTYTDGNVALGMRRLSIIDVGGGKQPVHNEDETIWVILNGEIYNYRDLRRDLETRGHRFYTQSDTEAIVHAYEEYGESCVQRLNGMFAWAVWDKRRRRLVIARDRMGIKPLFYTLQGTTLAFASELRALLTCPGISRQIDASALNEYLSFEHVPTPHCIIKGVRKLRPGHILSFDVHGLREEPYWDVPFAAGRVASEMRAGEAAQELLERIKQAVRMELVSDVPLGVFLSGGIDSSAVTAAASLVAPERLNTFSIAFDDPSYDESRYARLVAQRLGVQHHEATFTLATMKEIVPRLGQLLDEPLGDSSFLPTYFLSRFARQHVTVALGGDGGDELFAGYPTMQAHRLAGYYAWLPPLLRSKAIPALIDRLPTSTRYISTDYKLKRFVHGFGFPPEVRHHRWMGSFTPEEKQGLLAPEVRAALGDADTYSIVSEHLRRCPSADPWERLSYLDLKLYMEGDILQKVDRASMACSLEVRPPLLNPVVVEYVARLPFQWKLRGFATKWILKRSLEGVLPSEVLGKQKKGFNIPIAQWIKEDLRPLVQELLARPCLERQGLFDFRFVEQMLQSHIRGRANFRKQLWTLLAFQLWYAENIGKL
ncbi:MAG: asparagine synthase (glutamine-hydrolyzing) [Chloroflexi bacterium]|nr:asparagine synthase (glutamine-hydrolyzing) [Chloroflexota bacterium]